MWLFYQFSVQYSIMLVLSNKCLTCLIWRWTARWKHKFPLSLYLNTTRYRFSKGLLKKTVESKSFIYFEAIYFSFSWDNSDFYYWNEVLTEFCTLSLVLWAKNKIGSTEFCNLMTCLMYPLKTITFILKYFSHAELFFSLV